MRVNCNISAIIANNQLSKSEDALSSAIERLSSGLRINTSIQGIPKEPDTRDKNISEGKVRIDTSSQEDILATLYPWRCISGCFRQAIQKICHTKKRKQLQEQSRENHLVLNKRRVDHRTVGGNPSLTQLLSRLSWTLQEL